MEGLISIREYDSKDILERTMDPLVWWKNFEQNNSFLKTIVPVVKKFLPFPATSVLQKKPFRLCGDIDSQSRNRLDPDNLEMICFPNMKT